MALIGIATQPLVYWSIQDMNGLMVSPVEVDTVAAEASLLLYLLALWKDAIVMNTTEGTRWDVWMGIKIIKLQLLKNVIVQ